MLAISGHKPGLHIFVTHDTLVAATAWRLMDKNYDPKNWPQFLESALFWQHGNGITCAFGSEVQHDVIPAT